MSTTVGIITASGDGFVGPGPNSFDFSEQAFFHVGSVAVTKPIGYPLLASILVLGFFYAAARNSSILPSRLPFAGDSAYRMVRTAISPEFIVCHDVTQYIP